MGHSIFERSFQTFGKIRKDPRNFLHQRRKRFPELLSPSKLKKLHFFRNFIYPSDNIALSWTTSAKNMEGTPGPILEGSIDQISCILRFSLLVEERSAMSSWKRFPTRLSVPARFKKNVRLYQENYPTHSLPYLLDNGYCTVFHGNGKLQKLCFVRFELWHNRIQTFLHSGIFGYVIPNW